MTSLCDRERCAPEVIASSFFALSFKEMLFFMIRLTLRNLREGIILLQFVGFIFMFLQLRKLSQPNKVTILYGKLLYIL